MNKVFPNKQSSKTLPRELNTIIQIGQSIIAKSFDYDHVIQAISNGLSDLLQIETAAIYILENEKELWLGATTPPLDPAMPDTLRWANLFDHPHINQAVVQLSPVVVYDVYNEPLSPAELMVVKLRNLRSLIFLPFEQNGKAIGVLILGTCNSSRKFSEHEVKLAQTVAKQLSIAIQNARLHKDLMGYKENLERLVVERTFELESVNEELKSINEELHQKNSIILQQKEELETTLTNLKTVQFKLFQA